MKKSIFRVTALLILPLLVCLHGATLLHAKTLSEDAIQLTKKKVDDLDYYFFGIPLKPSKELWNQLKVKPQRNIVKVKNGEVLFLEKRIDQTIDWTDYGKGTTGYVLSCRVQVKLNTKMKEFFENTYYCELMVLGPEKDPDMTFDSSGDYHVLHLKNGNHYRQRATSLFQSIKPNSANVQKQENGNVLKVWGVQLTAYEDPVIVCGLLEDAAGKKIADPNTGDVYNECFIQLKK